MARTWGVITCLGLGSGMCIGCCLGFGLVQLMNDGTIY